MNLTTCPGCRESFAVEQQLAVIDDPELVDTPVMVWTEHFTAPNGDLFCCNDCYLLNG